MSQIKIEKQHVTDALNFELSKVKTPVIRSRMISHLMNIDQDLATSVAKKLGMKAMPRPADAAQPTRQNLPESPALSIIRNGPASFAGRKMGAFVSDGAPAQLIQALKKALDDEGVLLKIIAPQVGGVMLDNGEHLEADELIDGGP